VVGANASVGQPVAATQFSGNGIPTDSCTAGRSVSAVLSSVVTMAGQLVDLMTDEVIISCVGVDAFVRGRSYARTGRVSDIQVREPQRVVLASVRGTRPAPYRTIVQFTGDRRDIEANGVCTCPVAADCKHVAATLLAARGLGPPALAGVPAQSSATRPPWELPLAAVVEAFAVEQRAEGTPIALQFEAVATSRSAGYRRTQDAVSSGPSRVRIRPVVPGRSGGWVRSGISWRDLPYDVWNPRVRAHRQALQDIYSAYLSRGTGYGSYADHPVFLDDFGPLLWPLLARAADAGVAFVPVKPAPGPITLAAAPATVALDVRRPSDSEAVHLQVSVTLGGVVVPADAMRLVGRPAHGVVIDPMMQPESPGTGLLLAALAEPLSEPVANLLSAAGDIEIPPHDVDRFRRDYYPRLRQAITVTSSGGGVDLPEVCPPRLLLRVAYSPDSPHEVSLTWWFAYRIGDQTTLVAMGDPRPQLGVRDLPAERLLVRALELPTERLSQLWTELGAVRRLAPTVCLSGLDAVCFTTELLPTLIAGDQVDVEVEGEPTPYRHSETAPLIQVSATETKGESDWFDLGITLTIDGEDVPFQRLFAAIAQGETHLILDSGMYFSIERPEYAELRRLIDEAKSLQDKESSRLQLSAYQAGLWADLARLGVVEEQSERWARTVKGLLDVDTVPLPRAPDGLVAKLRPYQREGFGWLTFLRDHGLGGILADDMGLGKTVQALALLCRAAEQEPSAAPFLVVAPTSVVHNWGLEARRFTPGLRVVCVGETQRRGGVQLAERTKDAHIVVTSYALLRIDFEAYDALPWSGLVLDEAQVVKNYQAKTYQCARRLTAPFKLAITGTPLENNLMDLWSLLSIVAPGLFPNPQHFTEHYRRPIERGTAPELLATLRRRVRPLMLRRTKEQVAAELPPKQEQVLEVTLHPRHARVYQTHLQRERQKVLGLIGDMDRNRFAIFRSLTLLRQLSLAPALVDERYADVRSSKVDAFLEQVTEVVREGHRALVFSQFTSFLALVRQRLDEEGVDYCYLDGQTRDRGRQVASFKAGIAPVFLISLKAGGFGLNLTEADYVFVLDPWWNPAVEAQAVDRTHRIGQDKTVMVYRLVAVGTIEEKVMELKARKQDLFDKVMDGNALLSAPLTAEDVQGLFGL
jgi:superfamily II DNA or RNA helicase